MEKKDIQKALEEIKKQPKRNFVQSYDLVINLKNFLVKQNPLSFSVTLPHPKGKKIKVAAFVAPELLDQAKEYCDLVIREADFPSYADKKAMKKLAESYDYFIAQANLMPKVASHFGKVLGTKGKMPNPKMGCVVPPTADLKSLVSKLGKTIQLSAKKETNLQCLVGKEDQAEEHIIENIMTVYQAALKQLPNELQNIKDIYLKLTMGKPVKVA